MGINIPSKHPNVLPAGHVPMCSAQGTISNPELSGLDNSTSQFRYASLSELESHYNLPISMRYAFEIIIPTSLRSWDNSSITFQCASLLKRGIHYGAGDRARTGDVQLGKLTFYH